MKKISALKDKWSQPLVQIWWAFKVLGKKNFAHLGKTQRKNERKKKKGERVRVRESSIC